MTFELHPALKKKNLVGHLTLSTVLLEDESQYPWLILVPRRDNIRNLMELPEEDHLLLMKEVTLVQKALWDLFAPKQLNVAAIGNKTPQLHIHVIARFENDPAWPNTVWDHPNKRPYSLDQKEKILQLLRDRLRPFLLSEEHV